MIELDGLLNLYIHTHKTDDEVRIEVTDDKSGLRVVEIKLTRDNFAKALGKLAFIPCKFTMSDAKNIGKKREVKIELVFIPIYCCTDDENMNDKRIREQFAPFEVDGWVGDIRSAQNHHNVDKYDDNGKYYNVTFSRYV